MVNQTDIDWATHSWNPVTGCRNDHSYCYARRIWERFRESWGHKDVPFSQIILHKARLKERIPRGYCFVGSMSDCQFWDEEWWPVLRVVQNHPNTQFLFLTHDVAGITNCELAWEEFDEDLTNILVGITAETTAALNALEDDGYGADFISIEPFLLEGMVDWDWKWFQENRGGCVRFIMGGLSPATPVYKEKYGPLFRAIRNNLCFRGFKVFIKRNAESLAVPTLRQPRPKLQILREFWS